MLRKTLILTAFLILPGPSLAQSAPGLDLTLPDPGRGASRHQICAEQIDANPRPQWVEEVSARESYREMVLYQIYRSLAAQAVVDAEDCACETRFPSWDEADEVYQRNYRDLDPNEHTAVGRDYTRAYNAIRGQMMNLCRAQERA